MTVRSTVLKVDTTTGIAREWRSVDLPDAIPIGAAYDEMVDAADGLLLPELEIEAVEQEPPFGGAEVEVWVVGYRIATPEEMGARIDTESNYWWTPEDGRGRRVAIR